MVKVKEDFTGKTFDRLTVICQADDYITPNGKHLAMWECACDCGNPNHIKVLGDSLKRGNTKSCGCLAKENLEFGRRKQLNIYDLSENYGVGRTYNTNNEFYFDLEDYNKIKNYSWHENDQGYIVSSLSDNRKIRLHRLILNAEDGYDVDHVNHNKLDNRKENLRICTRQQNIFNSQVRSTNKSGKTGVWWNEKIQKWRAMITVDGKDIILGWFENIQDAIQARVDAEVKYFKDYRYKEVDNEYFYECN